ncbi:MAG: hypothetical protein MI861_02855 [Pirellulales bacterium]|nr:hypothetical protein [Pirellulales bacterium]
MNSLRHTRASIHWPMVIVITAWLMVVSLGSGFLVRYANQAGTESITPARWPQQSSLALSGRGPTLIMFAHPKCPCTAASVSELGGILESTGRRATVVFWQPRHADSSWTQSALVRRCQQHPRIDVVIDHHGQEIERFGATTSGYCVVYDSRHDLVFRGGITNGRGRVGINAGRLSVARLMSDTVAEHTDFPVFGCSLQSCAR